MKSNVAIVLGPHRSGTSLLTAGLESLGAYLAIRKPVSSHENPQGFFEHEAIVAFNERLLAHLGGRWDNPLFDGLQAIVSQDPNSITPWYREAAEIFVSSFHGLKFIAIKDPRMCQLLPFWRRVLGDCGYKEENIHYVHIARHPFEVAQSQQKRKRLNPSYYCLGSGLFETVSLWLSLSYQSLRNVDSDRNILVLYDELVDNPACQLQRLARFLGVPGTGASVDKFCSSFVNKGLKRNLAGTADDDLVTQRFPEAVEFYRKQRTLALKDTFSRTDVRELLDIWSRASTQRHFIRPLIPVISSLATERLSLMLQVDRQEEEIKRLEAVMNDIERFKAELDDVRSERDRLRVQYEAEQGARASQEAILDDVRAERERLDVGYREQLDSLHAEIEQILRSVSWRITEPLRRVRSLQIRGSRRLAVAWLRARIQGRSIHRRFTVVAPGSSRCIYLLLRPLLRLLDPLFAKINNHASVSAGPTVEQRAHGPISEYQQERVDPEYRPLVSVIVPNFNHEPYLRRRLESVFGQTYTNYEVILLDDCSRDGSQKILEEYCNRYPQQTQLIINDANSGGVFFQWEKGLAKAAGELVWIAESDDWCSDNFIEELVKYFADEAVMLAYCRTVFMDGEGQTQIWSIEEYLADIDADLWLSPFIRTAHDIVRKAWATTNIIPNVSSALFRKPVDMPLLREQDWKQMTICGDWLFYLNLIRGGLVAYTNAATNYYRIHSDNTSVASYSRDVYYREHELVATQVNRLFQVSDEAFVLQRDNIRQHWIRNRPDFSEEQFATCYSLARIREAAKLRKPNVLMAGYAFAAGGGETFPIQLANILKEDGYNVTFISFDQEEREGGVRTMLRSDIPVLNNFYNLQKLVTDFGIDIIHSHHAWVDNTILDLLQPGSRCRTVISLHGMYETIADKDLKKMLPRVMARTGKLVYIAAKNLEPFKKFGEFEEKRFVRIGNALETCPISPVNLQDMNIHFDSFVLCLVSRAIPEKGWQEAVESVGAAREISGVDIHLLLIGDGPEYNRLMKKGCPGYVHLLGFRKNVRDYYAAADMGFLPSRFSGESFPLTVIECLTAGRPVLASDVGEIRDMLGAEGDLAGCLFELRDWQIPVDELAEKISRCATDNHYYQCLSEAVTAAAEKFNPYTMRDKYAEVYSQLHRDPSVSDSGGDRGYYPRGKMSGVGPVPGHSC